MEFGVGFILIFHLFRNALAIMQTALVIFSRDYHHPDGKGSLIVQAGFALAGVPLIFFAFWGLRNKFENPLRIYAYYLLLGFVIDEVLASRELLRYGTCEHRPGTFIEIGQAFACGAERIVELVAMTVLTSVEVYFAFVIFSHCEALRVTGGGVTLADLTYGKPTLEDAEAKALQGYIGVGEAVCTLDGYGTIPIIPINSDCAKIFGTRHDLQYPPMTLHK